jgi:type I restriction enzyme M protein
LPFAAQNNEGNVADNKGKPNGWNERSNHSHIRRGRHNEVKLRPYYRIPPKEWAFTSNPDVAVAQVKALSQPDKDERQIEEYVRQWILRELVESYNYPREWFGEKIVIEETVQVATAEKEADISIKNDRGRTYIYIETKNSGVTKADFDKAERQLETYLSSTHTATIGMLTSASETKVLRKKVNPNDFDYIPDIPEYGAKEKSNFRLVRNLEILKEQRGRVGLEPLPKRHQNILFEAHSTIRDIDGLHDDNALDELCKVIYTKIYDERTATLAEPGKETEFRFQTFGKASGSEVASEIRDLYKDACEYDLHVYSQRIPNYERSRGVFREQIGLSDAALSRVVELLQEYSIIDADIDIKSSAFQKVLGSAIRAGMGQYFTPDEVVRIAVEVVAPCASSLILDPFAGSGHFLSRSLDYVVQKYAKTTDPYTLYQFKMFHLHGIEKSPRMVRIAMTDMLIHDDGHSNLRNTDALLSFDNYPDILSLSNDDNKDPQVFDLILTNPPFGSLMREEARKMLGRFQLGHKKRSLPLEVLALERCFQFLKPGGRLAIVLPDGNLGNSNVQFVRDWLLQHMMLKGVVSLPTETFSPYGTTTKTSLCFFQKLRSVADKKLDYDVAFFLLGNIGYDATGRSRIGNEVQDCIDYMTKAVNWEPLP